MKAKQFLPVAMSVVSMVFAVTSAGWAQSAPVGSGSSQASSVAAGNPPAAPSAGSAPSAESTAAAATTAPGGATTSKIEVPGGTHIPLVLHNAISTRSARAGDPVYFETLFPVMEDGKVVIPAGSYISGEVTESKRPGRVKGRGELMLKLTTMILPNAYMVNLNASPSNAGTGGGETVNGEGAITGDSDKASDAGTVIKSTGAGAGIGGIAAGPRGAGIGAGIGVAAGLAAVLLSRGPEAELPRGSTVEIVTNRAILLDADKVQFTGPGQASALPGPANREPQRQRIPF
jgi:type IV secretion system protein VirB10